MTRPVDLLDVGRLGRAHGIRGDIVVILTSDRVERVQTGARLLAGDRWLTVERARPQSDRWVVHFVEVNDRTEAESLAGRTLAAEPLPDSDALWVHELIGARVDDSAGIDRGICVAVVANPASDLLELDDGSLVPAVFVTGIADGTISIDPPDGLFDLGVGS
ncbi:MAG: ribosome maturation factor RimM [Ilumatobacteraceae bacterium]